MSNFKPGDRVRVAGYRWDPHNDPYVLPVGAVQTVGGDGLIGPWSVDQSFAMHILELVDETPKLQQDTQIKPCCGKTRLLGDRCPVGQVCPHDQQREVGPPEAPFTGYPDNNPKTVMGLAKPSLRCVPPIAMFTMGQAMADGGRKYGPFNWRENTVSASVYYDAIQRHLMAWWEGEQAAADSGVHHLGHAMACMALVLDAEALGKLNDDRASVAGPLPSWLKVAKP